MPKQIKSFLFSGLILFFSLDVHAQLQCYRSLTSDDGLIQSDINCMMQDNAGYLWIGTNNGISRWDGHSFENFNKNQGLINDYVQTIFQVSNGDILIGTNSGVSIFQDSCFVDFIDEKQLLSGRVNCIYQSENGKIYFGTNYKGVVAAVQDRFEYLSKETGLASGQISTITEDHSGNLLIGYKYSGMGRVKNGEVVNFTDQNGLPSNRVRSISRNIQDEIIITTARGVCKYYDGVFELLIKDDALDFVKGAECELWIDKACLLVTSRNIFQLKNNEITVLDVCDEGLSDYNCLFVTRNGTLYLGTSGNGIRIYKEHSLFTVDNPDVGFNRLIFGITNDAEGNICFSNRGGEVGIYKDGTVVIARAPENMTLGSIYSLLKDVHGRVLCGSSRMGVFLLESGQLITTPEFAPMAGERIIEIFQARDETIYLGTYKNLWAYKDGSFRDVANDMELGENKFGTIYETRDSTLFLGLDDCGIITIKNGKKSLYTKKDGLTDDEIHAIFQSSDGTILISTDYGVNVFENNRFRPFEYNDELVDNIIYGIEEDNKGNLYFTSTRGVNIVDKSFDPPRIRRLLKSDGLASNEMNSEAIYKDDRGRIWFGTIAGISCYDPSLDFPNKHAPVFGITSVEVMGEQLPDNGFFTIQGNENIIRFNYRAIDLDSPEKVMYFYRLVGHSTKWRRTTDRTMTYSNIGSGKYTFEIHAQNDWGYSSPLSAVSFSVSTPLWKNWYLPGSLLLLTFLAGLFYFLTRKKDAQLARDSKALIPMVELQNLLSKRELEVTRLLIEGYSYQEIADRLFLALTTVQSHVKNIYKKLNVHSKLDLLKKIKVNS
ncbi:hypothetical protein KAR48_07040 [bacterium]|nr:hypothetical protein [bacterium]